MCLIIGTQDVNIVLDKITNQELLAAARSNDDGVGVMYMRQEEGKPKPKLVVEKLTPSHSSPAEVVDFIMHHATQANVGPFAAHMRGTTDGTTCDLNTHPYQVTSLKQGDGKDIYMMHNGVISFCRSHRKWDKDDETMSDTAVFVEDYLKPILKEKPKLILNAGFQNMVTQIIGTGNKLLFMDDTGQIVFINKQAGAVRAGDEGGVVWLSSPWYLQTSYTRGGSQTSGTGNFCGTKGQKTTSQEKEETTSLKQQNTGSSTGSTNVLVLPDKDKNTSLIKETLKAMTGDQKKQLMTSNAAFKLEPDIHQPEYRKECAELRDFLKGYTFQDLADYIADCPEEAANLLYLHLHAYTYDKVDKEFIEKCEDIKPTETGVKVTHKDAM